MINVGDKFTTHWYMYNGMLNYLPIDIILMKIAPHWYIWLVKKVAHSSGTYVYTNIQEEAPPPGKIRPKPIFLVRTEIRHGTDCFTTYILRLVILQFVKSHFYKLPYFLRGWIKFLSHLRTKFRLKKKMR